MKQKFIVFLITLLSSIYSNGQMINEEGIELKNRQEQLSHEVISAKIKGYDTIKDSTRQASTSSEIRNSKRNERKLKRKKRRIYRKRKSKKMIYGGCCFVKGTQVLMSDKTSKDIDNLVVGDYVLSYDFDLKKVISSTILTIDIVKHNNIIEVVFDGDIKVKNTADHPYYVVGKGICSFSPNETFLNYGIEANQMEIGDLCYNYQEGELNLLKVETITKVEGVFITYNISELDRGNNYFVNGVLVNNEKQKATNF